MKTPISADVISGDALQSKGVLKVDDLQFVSPAVTVNNFGQGIDFNIRGIGKGEHNSQTLTGVITYRDGVPTFPGYLTEEPYYDISSIEILRGPQGTFVGQNATGGAVFANSNNPQIGGGYDGYGFAQYGNYNDVNLQGALNIPLSDTFAIPALQLSARPATVSTASRIAPRRRTRRRASSPRRRTIVRPPNMTAANRASTRATSAGAPAASACCGSP